MEPWRVINSQGDGPYAVKTLFGWAISGPLGSCDGEADHGECPNGVPHVGVNFISMEPCLDKMMEQHFNHEFSERSCDEKLENSQEDIKFLKMVSESIQFKDGQYQIGLPFRNPDFVMPNNRAQAEQRAQQLKRKLQRNQEFHADYKNFVGDIVKKGYARRVPESELGRDDGKVWYLPHHGVYHPMKPNKIRVVFDSKISWVIAQ